MAVKKSKLAPTKRLPAMKKATKPGRCKRCQEAEHATCPLIDGCPCCEYTMRHMDPAPPGGGR